MIRKKPVTGLDPVMETGFPKRSCSTKMLERKSVQFEAICAPRRQQPQRGRAKLAA
jgi:hypothetical protein